MRTRDETEEELLRKIRTIRSRNVRNLLWLWSNTNGVRLFPEDIGVREKRYRPFPSLNQIMRDLRCSKRTAQDYLVACLIIEAAEGFRFEEGPERFIWEPERRKMLKAAFYAK